MKRGKMNKNIGLVIVFLLSIFISIIDIEAIENDSFYNGEYISGTYIKKIQNDGTGRYETARFLRRSSDGNFAYCLQPFLDFAPNNIQVAHSSDYANITNMTNEQWNRISLLAYYGYQYKNHVEDKWYIITQMMIWKTVDPISDIYFTDTLNGNKISLYENEINEIESLIDSHYVKPSFDNTNQTMSIGSSITLDDTNRVLSNFTVEDNLYVTTTIDGNNLNIKANIKADTTLTLVKKDKHYNNPPIVYIDPVSQDLLVVGSYEPLVSNININIVGGKIKLIRVDSETNTSVAQGDADLVGATYNVYDKNNNIVSMLIVQNDKTSITDFLPFGDYTIKEVSPSNGYYLDENVYKVTIDSANIEHITVKSNAIKGKIKITKYDSETNSCKSQGDANLVGAKYGIYDNKNNLVETIAIDLDCTATSKSLPYGNYKVKEINSSLGYKIDTNSYDVNIISDKTINIISKEEVIKGKIKITKYDSELNACESQGEASLIGSKYGIYDDNNNLVDTITIESNCTGVSKLLPYGEYKIKEIVNSKGYYLNENMYSKFILNEEIYSLKVTNNVIKNTFNFYKFYGNEDTGFIYAEANASFDIYNKNNVMISSIITDKNGLAKIILPYGDYTIKQGQGIEDYKMIYPFSISVNEQTDLNRISYLKNGSITAKLKLINIDNETNINIKGAKFKIKNKKTNEYICQTTDRVICEFQTNEDGIMITPLPLFGGEYIIEQIEAPIGYLLSKDYIEISIKNNIPIIYDSIYGYLIEVTLKNKPVKGKIEINKIGEKFLENNSYEEIPMKDVLFGLYDENKNLITTVSTNKNGYATIENLNLGKYILKELKSSNNNVIDKNEYEIELNYIDQYTPVISKSFNLKNYYQKGDLEIVMLDKINNQILPNIKIDIYLENNKLIDSYITDENGKIIVNNLPVNEKFYIIQKETQTGYLINDEKIFFELKENNEILKINIINEKINSDIIIHKVDENNNKLSGVEIGIFDSKDNLLNKYTTNEKGIVKLNLSYGFYYYKELKTLDNYILDTEKHYFNVKNNNEKLEFNLINKKQINDSIIEEDNKENYEQKESEIEENHKENSKNELENGEDKKLESSNNEYEIIDVPNTGIKKYSKFNLFGMIFIFLGIGFVKYEKIK